MKPSPDNTGGHFDFHSHILPALDHGCADLLASLRQLEYAVLAGVKNIAATSHFYAADCPLSSGISIAEFAGLRKNALDLLKSEYSGEINLLPACEAHLTRALVESDGLDALCVNGTKYILTEPDFSDSESATVDLLSVMINERGLKPVIAHIDRYGTRMLRVFKGMGLDIQINAEAVVNFFTYRRFRGYIADGSVSLLGSDVHSDPLSSYRNYSRAVSILGSNIQRFDDRAREISGVEKASD